MSAASPGERDRPKRARSTSLKDRFRLFAHSVAHASGSPVAFGAAAAAIVLWALSGPLFGFSDTWRLVVNTGTTLVTFLMVFLIQSTQDRDAAAMHLKLDELIRATSKARDRLVDLEDASDEQLEALEAEFRRMRGDARQERRRAVRPRR